MSRRVKAAPARDPDAHLAAKRAAMQAAQTPQIWLLLDEAETRAVAAWRRAPAAVREQARAALKPFEEA